ncbi:MAG: hypothetical protein GF399_12255 [Candidatus Coatesbacteria bacterium]|nr:hypothetical protein [Candidatus Coatesbacteria bacterium]
MLAQAGRTALLPALLILVLVAACGEEEPAEAAVLNELAELGDQLAPHLVKQERLDDFAPAEYRRALDEFDESTDAAARAVVNLRAAVDALAAYRTGELPGDLVAAQNYFDDYTTALEEARDE